MVDGSFDRPIRVGVLASVSIISAGLQVILEQEVSMCVAFGALTLEEAVEKVSASSPEVVIVESEFAYGPDGYGRVVQKLRADDPTLAVVVLANHESDVVGALRGGVRGFLLRDAPPEEITAALRLAVGGSVPVSPKTLPHLVTEVVSPSTVPCLSQRECEVLRFVSRGMTNKRIAEKLFLSEATVKTHLRRVFNKLEVPDRTAAVARAMVYGIIERPLSTQSQSSASGN